VLTSAGRLVMVTWPPTPMPQAGSAGPGKLSSVNAGLSTVEARVSLATCSGTADPVSGCQDAR
jgi:hypothetical protein